MKIIFYLISIQFVGFFFYGGFRTIFPFILEEIGYSEQEIVANWSIIFTIALFIGGFLTRIPMGILTDRLSRLQGLMIGTTISMLSVLAIFFTTNILILGILFALLRTGTHVYPLTSRSYVNETNPSKQGRFNGLILISANIASFVSPIVLYYFLEVSLITLIAFSNFILLFTCLIFVLFTPKKMKRKKFSVNTILVKSIYEIFQMKKIIFIFIIIGVINGGFNYILVPYAKFTLKQSSFTTTIIVGLVQITTIFFILVTGELNSRIGMYNLVFVGILLIFIGALILSFQNLSIIVFIISSMFINGGLQINTNTLVTQVTLSSSNETSGTAFGIASGFFFLGGSIIPIFIGQLYSINPIFPYFLIIFLTVLLSVSVCVVRKLENINIKRLSEKIPII
jgi:MFS family permease